MKLKKRILKINKINVESSIQKHYSFWVRIHTHKHTHQYIVLSEIKIVSFNY